LSLYSERNSIGIRPVRVWHDTLETIQGVFCVLCLHQDHIADWAEKVDPTRYRYGINPALRLTGFLGFFGGFMLAYQRSSCESIRYSVCISVSVLISVFVSVVVFLSVSVCNLVLPPRNPRHVSIPIVGGANSLSPFLGMERKRHRTRTQ
jgi:hypothetical protein